MRNKVRATFWICLGGVLATPGVVCAAIGPSNVLLVWNSANTVSTSVHDLYVAARPGVVEFDLNDASIVPGSISRANYVTKIRTPIKDFINGAGPLPDLSGQIMVIATTRGLPARINSPVGTDEFVLSSAWSSVESDLALLQQDLEQAGTSFLPFRYHGLIDNPYHRLFNAPIDSFARNTVKVQRQFSAIQTATGPNPGDFVEAWQVTGLGPGGIYLVCRIDSGPADFNDPAALDNIALLLERSMNPTVCASQVQALLDEYGVPPATFELDDGCFPPLFCGINDFENTALTLASLGIDTLHDKTTNFFEGPELVEQTKPLFILGTYGENHDINGWGENPPGSATYLQTYNFPRASILLNIESWSGTSMHSPTSGRNAQQAQVLSFIELGGSFAIGQVMEPFTFGIADLEMIVVNMLDHGLTFAEAAWSALPALSWQNIPVGDPLARIILSDGAPFDRNGDNTIDLEDLYVFHSLPLDHDCDGMVNDDDRVALQNAIRTGEQDSL